MTERDDYTPRFYVAPRDPATDLDLTTLQSVYDQHPDVVATEMVARRPGFRRDEETVLAVDVAHIDRVTPLARQARQLSDYPVGDLACFNVDFSREFRYCLETGADPTPASELSTLRLSVPVTETSNDVYGELSVADDTVTGSPTDLLTAVQGALDAHDPDVLVCSTSEIVPTLHEIATAAGVDDFSLSRWPDRDYQQLASRSTYSSLERLVERNRVSKPVEAYTQYTQNVAALERASYQDIAIHPGQDIEYVVIDDEKSSRERVALAHESIDTYDSSYYETTLIRAVESILSPVGWDRTEIKRTLAESRDAEITSY